MRIQSISLGGYKMFKGIALSDAAFKSKYGRKARAADGANHPQQLAVETLNRDENDQAFLDLQAQALLLELELLDMEEPYSIHKGKDAFVRRVLDALLLKTKHNKLTLEKLAAGYGITDKNMVKELTELAIVITARRIAHEPATISKRYQKIVALYERQVNLSHRTSQSILLQQYSTPAPIGYLAGVFCRLDYLAATGGLGFEPSAGNGLLTIAGYPRNIIVNEIDETRRANLSKQRFIRVGNRDASQSFGMDNCFDAVITNPPFGALDTPIAFGNFKIRTLDHAMALYALETMKDDGFAAIIIGGHTKWDAHGRIQEGKNRLFFNYLYHHYYVRDAINISGKKLYSRQGTSFDVRLILVAGRKHKPEGAAPLKSPLQSEVATTFDQLFQRVMSTKDS